VSEGHPAPPIKLYERWERQHWSVLDYDLEADVAAWRSLPPLLRRELHAGIVQYFLGEAAVAEMLTPLVAAAPTTNDQLYLATQLADEARHTVFFQRYLQAVDGDDRPIEAYLGGLQEGRGDGHFDLFDRRLRAATERARLNPEDRSAWYSAITLYHLLLEAVLAINGERVLLDIASGLGTVPVLVDGLRKVARDESRHISFGVGALRRGADAGHLETIVDVVIDSLPSLLDVLVAPRRRYPALVPPDVLESRAEQLLEFCGRARAALLKRLRYIGAREALPVVDRGWGAALAAAFDRYEELHGTAHPVRRLGVREPALAQRAG